MILYCTRVNVVKFLPNNFGTTVPTYTIGIARFFSNIFLKQQNDAMLNQNSFLKCRIHF